MVTQSSQSTSNAQERRSVHVVHYDLSYVVYGAEHGTDGAIVLLHDVIGGAFTWDNVVAQMGSLSRAVYAIDMLGFGQSDHPWPADTSIWGQADCINFLFQQLNLTHVVLVGHGIGGGVAQVLATRLCPERIAALALIDTTCYEYAFAPDWPLPDMKKQQDPEQPRHLKLEDFMKTLKETIPAGSTKADDMQEALQPYIEQWDSELEKEVFFQQIRQLLSTYSNSVSSDLRTLRKPTLIIWGEKDAQFPLKFAQRLHRAIPESRLVIIPDAGHMILFDAPAQVASALNDFLGRL